MPAWAQGASNAAWPIAASAETILASPQPVAMNVRPHRSFSLSPEAVQRWGLGVGATLVLWCALFVLITAALRPFGIHLPGEMAVLAAVLAVAGVRWSLALSWPALGMVLLGAAAAAGVAVELALAWRDITYDGQAIHLPSALELSAGLNPVTERPDLYWSAVYPNGLWTLQGLFIALIPGLEVGKAPAWMLAMASMPLAALALRTVRGAWTAGVGVAALLVQANPVLVLQLTSFELDGVVHSLTVAAVAGAVLLQVPAFRRCGVVVLLATVLLLVNTKMTGAYWASAVVLAVLLQEGMRLRRWPLKLGGALLVTLALAVLLVGWRPFVTTHLETGEWLGAGVSVVAGPDHLKEAGPGERMAYLVAGESANPVGEQAAQLKWPWEFSRSEFVSLLDIRIGGFGPGFGLQAMGALLLLAGLSMRWRPSEGTGAAWLGAFWVGALVLATWAFPLSWWARLVSPFWLASVLPLALPWPRSAGQWGPMRAMRLSGTALLLAGCLISSASTAATLRLLHTANAAMSEMLANASAQSLSVRIVSLSPLENDHTPLVWYQRLLEASILPQMGDREGCGPLLFSTGSVQLCVATQP